MLSPTGHYGMICGQEFLALAIVITGKVCDPSGKLLRKIIQRQVMTCEKLPYLNWKEDEYGVLPANLTIPGNQRKF
jgi:hypothetical protein